MKLLLVFALIVAASADGRLPTKAVDGQYFIRLDENIFQTRTQMQDFSEKIEREMNIYGVQSFLMGKLKLLFVKGEHNDVMKAKGLDGVKYVEHNQETMTAQSCVSDPCPGVWGLDRTDQREKLPYESPSSEEAVYTWGDYQGNSVVAYVADTGIYTGHSEFGGRARWGFTAPAIPNNGDYNGHGTHIAGTIGSFSYGLAKSVSLVDVKVLNDNGGATTLEAVQGLEWIQADHEQRSASMGAMAKSVVNLSLIAYATQSLDDAVVSCVDAGVVVVPAAGNQDDDACLYSPSRVPSGITVGATDVTDTSLSYTNWGSCVDIFAPGRSILSTDWDGSTTIMSGTSMAAPHVCGVVARYMDQFSAAPTPADVSV